MPGCHECVAASRQSHMDWKGWLPLDMLSSHLLVKTGVAGQFPKISQAANNNTDGLRNASQMLASYHTIVCYKTSAFCNTKVRKEKVKVEVYGLVSGTKCHSPNYTQLSPGHRTCPFISHLNSPGSTQHCCHHSAGNYSNAQKPSLSYQAPSYSWVLRVHMCGQSALPRSRISQHN